MLAYLRFCAELRATLLAGYLRVLYVLDLDARLRAKRKGKPTDNYLSQKFELNEFIRADEDCVWAVN